MNTRSSFTICRRSAVQWTVYCCLNALPSFAIAFFLLELRKSPAAVAAMIAGIVTYIVTYTAVTTSWAPFRDPANVLYRSLHVGAKIRSVISGISLALLATGIGTFYTADFWCGYQAVAIVEMAGRRLGTGAGVVFMTTYLTTLLQGLILSIWMLVMSFFAVISIQARDRRRAFGAGNPLVRLR